MRRRPVSTEYRYAGCIIAVALAFLGMIRPYKCIRPSFICRAHAEMCNESRGGNLGDFEIVPVMFGFVFFSGSVVFYI